MTDPCPRCGGRVYRDDDYDGAYLSCINCGWLNALDRYDPDGQREPPRTATRGTRRSKLRGQRAPRPRLAL